MSVLVEAQRVAIARAIATNPDIGVEAGWGYISIRQKSLYKLISRYRDIMGETVSGLGGCSCQCWHGFTA